ncbi:stigma-specific STIG1-like protein 1 [Salvia hispanica]|uniref:stigma-specific STIG1-like protein 1 n=1 Tax=Salvia hispanica TaxID=49212 RepID=UPI00200931D8|nr:stigma-specific STIG1-like protein 1 [Salvia hispanica]
MRWLKLIMLLAMIILILVEVEAAEEEAGSLRGVSRFLAQRSIKCNKYPKICRAKGSSGPNCCKKRCVNVGTDRVNCGRCGHKCKFSEICCKGKCVNPFTHKKHCGGCGNKCGQGTKCSFGLCSYAN